MCFEFLLLGLDLISAVGQALELQVGHSFKRGAQLFRHLAHLSEHGSELHTIDLERLALESVLSHHHFVSQLPPFMVKLQPGLGNRHLGFLVTDSRLRCLPLAQQRLLFRRLHFQKQRRPYADLAGIVALGLHVLDAHPLLLRGFAVAPAILDTDPKKVAVDSTHHCWKESLSGEAGDLDLGKHRVASSKVVGVVTHIGQYLPVKSVERLLRVGQALLERPQFFGLRHDSMLDEPRAGLLGHLPTAGLQLLQFCFHQRQEV
mmetsp:Transcript_23747/g.34623  ORF Transcript_23747/g.34623 Transcript_23747/m.34623 type:complete len:261 (+) Transcript_23747:2305-3087(+)